MLMCGFCIFFSVWASRVWLLSIHHGKHYARSLSRSKSPPDQTRAGKSGRPPAIYLRNIFSSIFAAKCSLLCCNFQRTLGTATRYPPWFFFFFRWSFSAAWLCSRMTNALRVNYLLFIGFILETVCSSIDAVVVLLRETALQSFLKINSTFRAEQQKQFSPAEVSFSWTERRPKRWRILWHAVWQFTFRKELQNQNPPLTG